MLAMPGPDRSMSAGSFRQQRRRRGDGAVRTDHPHKPLTWYHVAVVSLCTRHLLVVVPLPASVARPRGTSRCSREVLAGPCPGLATRLA